MFKQVPCQDLFTEKDLPQQGPAADLELAMPCTILMRRQLFEALKALDYWKAGSGFGRVSIGKRSMKREVDTTRWAAPSGVSLGFCHNTHRIIATMPFNTALQQLFFTTSSTSGPVSTAAAPLGDTAPTVFWVLILIICSPSPPFSSTFQVPPSTTATDFGSASATITIPFRGTVVAVETVTKCIIVAVPPPSPPIFIVASNGDGDFFGTSSTLGTTSPQRILSNAVTYVVGFAPVDVIFMPPTTLSRFLGFLASDGDYRHFLPSSTVSTAGTSVTSPTATAGTVVTSISLIMDSEHEESVVITEGVFGDHGFFRFIDIDLPSENPAGDVMALSEDVLCSILSAPSTTLVLCASTPVLRRRQRNYPSIEQPHLRRHRAPHPITHSPTRILVTT
ncbi:hypothetical protein F5146DRAFT_1167099 [Armillaria mellea]|nr:hypothetical protein F5146DRAFT_1167099 [Armillaria mellea]